MPTPTKGPRLGGSPSHERIILDNLASQLFEHGRITTTEAKAKRVRPLAEKLITKAKRGDQHSRRLVMTHIRDKGVVHTLFTEIAQAVAERDGGYTRITKIGPRKGDNAPMAIIEIVTEAVTPKAKRTEGTGATAAPAAAPVAEEAASSDEVTEGDEVVSSDEVTEGQYRGENPPEGFTIKGNEDSMKYHTTESPWYDRTVAEVWFDSTEAAEKAGFVNAQGETAGESTEA